MSVVSDRSSVMDVKVSAVFKRDYQDKKSFYKRVTCFVFRSLFPTQHIPLLHFLFYQVFFSGELVSQCVRCVWDWGCFCSFCPIWPLPEIKRHHFNNNQTDNKHCCYFYCERRSRARVGLLPSNASALRNKMQMWASTT